jgi:hypothetical protein
MTKTAIKKEDTVVIIIDRLTTYKDFIINLTHNLFKYYIDDGSFDREDDRKFHRWCYARVCDDFLKENIDFSKNAALEEHLYLYHVKHFFNVEKKEPKTFVSFWEGLFDVKNIKNKNVFTILIEIYLLFNKSIEPRKPLKKKDGNVCIND